MTDSIEKWVHRVGRTGRAGKTGLAITFLSNDDDEVMFDLKQEISKSPISVMNPELARHEAARQKVTREMKVSVMLRGCFGAKGCDSGRGMSKRRNRRDLVITRLGLLGHFVNHAIKSRLDLIYPRVISL